MNKKFTFGIIFVLILIIVIVFSIKKGRPASPFINSNVENDTPTYLIQYQGTTSTDAVGNTIYTNKRLGLTFIYPKGWHMGSNALGLGSLQLFNYDESQYAGENFPLTENINKIEAAISATSTYGISQEISEKSRQHSTLIINGQNVTRDDVEFVSGQKIRIYYIPVPQNQDEYLSVIIYGNPSNFSVLDGIIKTVTWKK
ncbi:MAG: hypothetical protein JWO00_708 [Candidatus Parcubacteria bacterium]|nr:hypothetical protein [Candidatus Parcubacteria bacterium]